ncbi:MAG: hypothetical protein K6B14_07770 [Lachnospiraceae bacterium]|nr:hypothetical protein [Lachnospiraceae bacterium]
MNNTQLYPFERNRYYPRKRMSSGDFTAEQTYMNNKRRFLNGLMYGSGVVCGLGVFSLDDLSFLVESGVAIDGMGREIVVETSDVKKLSAIEGFDSLRTNKASLCLKYKEEDVHKVYSIDQDDPGAEFQYNRVREGYTLFLMDQEDIPETFEMEGEFLLSSMLYSSPNYMVTFRMPASACRGHVIRAEVVVEKISDEDVSLSYSARLQTPTFISPDGTNLINVVLSNISLSAGDTVVNYYWMETLDTPVTTTNIILESGSASAFENDVATEVPANFMMDLTLTSLKPRQLVNREIGRMNLEMKNIGGQGDYIRLADFTLVRTESAYIIEEVVEATVKQYVSVPAQDLKRADYLEYFIKEADIHPPKAVAAALEANRELAGSRRTGIPEIATGIVEIPLGEDARRGDIFYSGEIMHGLGKGNVYVEVGYELISDDENASSLKSTIYGSPDIFGSEQKSVVNAETAVRVLNDKGSFVVGARLLDTVDYLMLTYRWIAIRFPSGDQITEEQEIVGASISPEMPTVRMLTKESHYFGVRFDGLEPCSLTYELTDESSGDITADGVYTAPAKAGVYEIRIFCTDMPKICTYAYAVVEKKGLEEHSEESENAAPALGGGQANMLTSLMK